MSDRYSSTALGVLAAVLFFSSTALATPESGAAADPPPGTYPAPTGKGEKRRSVGMMVGGIVTLGIGGVSVIAGMATVAAAQDAIHTCNYEDNTGCSFSTDEGLQAAGFVMMGVGGIAVGVGLPVMLVGMSKVPVEEDRAWYAPDVTIGPSSGSARWRF